MQFGPCILSTEPPIDSGFSSIALPLQGFDFPEEGALIGDTPLEATASQDTELDLRHIEPTAVLGSMVELQPFHDAPGLSGRKCLV